MDQSTAGKQKYLSQIKHCS